MLDKDDDQQLDAVSIFSGSSGGQSDLHLHRKPRQYDFSFSLPSPQQQQQQPMDVDTSGGGPIQLSLATPRPGEKKQKLNSGRARVKMRKLASGETDSSEAGDRGCSGGKTLRLRTVVCCSVVLLVAVLVVLIGKQDLREEFWKRYKEQYHELLYGVEDYCNQEFDFSATAGALSSGVIGQLEATAKSEEIVNRRRNERCTSIALLGSTGVGKSLMADIIAKTFQWQSNVHHFFWDYTFTPAKRFERFQSFLYGIRHGRDVELRCGRSLIIVDHLGSGDVDTINKIDARLRFVADKDDVQLMVLYVFQGALTRDNPEAVQHLSRFIERVQLRSLKEDDLRACIRLEAAEFGVDLDQHPGLLEELTSSVDWERYGCKPVRAKLAFHSQFSKNDS
ncbi:uncharacterized protein LOC109404730 [Aedes albopictus]|uniref:Uncharacterized protein n=1 Tax=Aedes albopictus TaxID=7160 RepID=A0ABM1Y9K9_AEDAL|nr:uncharacterized protein LOC109404730 [Aedes albopictus]